VGTRQGETIDGWGGRGSAPEPTPARAFDTGDESSPSLTLRAPALTLPGDEALPSSNAPPLDPRHYDGWNADRVKRSSLPPEASAQAITPLPPARAEDEARNAFETDEGDAFALVSRASGSVPTLDLVAEMAERFALGDFSGCLRAAELLLGQDPGHVMGRHYAREACHKLEALYRSRLEAQGRIPRLAMAENEVRWLGLDPQVGHILARIDGVADYQQVVEASGMPPLTALRTLVELVDGRVVRLV
jgi:hypothetical protein